MFVKAALTTPIQPPPTGELESADPPTVPSPRRAGQPSEVPPYALPPQSRGAPVVVPAAPLPPPPPTPPSFIRHDDVIEIDASEAESLPSTSVSSLPTVPLPVPATFEAADASRLALSSEIPLDVVERSQVSPARAAVMKLVVGVTLAACVAILVLAGRRMLQRRTAHAERAELEAAMLVPKPAPSAIEPVAAPKPAVEVPSSSRRPEPPPAVPVAAAPTSKLGTAPSTPPRTTAVPAGRHVTAPAKNVRSPVSSPRKANRKATR